MLTDQQALALIERVRRATPHIDVVELCDWALLRLVQMRKAPPTLHSTFKEPKEPTADRKAYMKEYMRKKRAEKRDAGG